MIKVIAADMDGTLLNSGHTISEQTYQTIQDVQQGGIRFMIATGRDYPSASDTLKNFPLDCDWVTGSGAEIRNRDGELLQTIPMDQKCFEQIVSCVEKFPAYIRFCTTRSVRKSAASRSGAEASGRVQVVFPGKYG